MNLILALSALIVALLTAAVVLSFFFTRRHGLTETHSPAEFGLAFEEISFTTSDGLTLRGVYIPCAGSDRAVILLHGHGGSLDYDVQRAPFLHAAGLNVLLFDLRAHGRSEGNATTFGHLERRDVAGAVDYLRARGIRQIGVLGFSLGGVVALSAASVCPEIAAVIADGAPARPLTALTAWGVERNVPGWIAFVMAWLAVLGASLRLRANLFRHTPVEWAAQVAPRPVLFIHGDQDQYCPDFDDLYGAASPPKEIWRVPEAGHTQVSEIKPEEYQRRVVEFLNRYLV